MNRSPLFGWHLSFMIVVAALSMLGINGINAEPSYLPSPSNSLMADDGKIILSRLNKKVSLVVSEEQKREGIVFNAISPSGCLSNDRSENKMTLAYGNSGCKIDMKWDKEHFYIEGRSDFHHNEKPIQVTVMADTATFKNAKYDKESLDCSLDFKPNNNTVQGGYVVEFEIKDITYNCALRLEFDSGYKLYEQIPDKKPIPSVKSSRLSDYEVAAIVLGSICVALICITLVAFLIYKLCCKKKNESVPLSDVTCIPGTATVMMDTTQASHTPGVEKTAVSRTQPTPIVDGKKSKDKKHRRSTLVPDKKKTLKSAETSDGMRVTPLFRSPPTYIQTKSLTDMNAICFDDPQELKNYKKLRHKTKAEDTSEMLGMMPLYRHSPPQICIEEHGRSREVVQKPKHKKTKKAVPKFGRMQQSSQKTEATARSQVQQQSSHRTEPTAISQKTEPSSNQSSHGTEQTSASQMQSSNASSVSEQPEQQKKQKQTVPIRRAGRLQKDIMPDVCSLEK